MRSGSTALATGRVDRRLAAILAADVAGYSRLMGADEEGTLDRLKAHRRELVDPKVKERHGRIVKLTGDGALVEFPSVVDAVKCAVEIQRAMADRNAEYPEDKRIAFRIGVNLGDVIIDGDDIYGDGVNIAARLEALAEPGGICLSRTVRDHVGDRLPYIFEDIGEQSVKNIAQPVHAWAMSAAAVAALPEVSLPAQSAAAPRRRPALWVTVAAASLLLIVGIGAAWRASPQRSAPAVVVPAASPQNAIGSASAAIPRLSFVVLPFENLSRDPDQEYFADGITDDLTTDLSRISGSFVIARNTAFTYKGKAVAVKQIGRELGVHYVIEGSVRRTGEQVQVNVRLTDAESGVHLWADRFDTDRKDLVEAQSGITGRLAWSLNGELARDVDRWIEQEREVSPDSRDLVMRGWAQWYRPMSKANRQEAQRSFEQALALDARSVDARIGLATVLVSILSAGWSSSVKQDEARAEQLLFEALERDPNSSMAHYAMTGLRRAENRSAEAYTEAEAAVALDRNNVPAEANLGGVLAWLGRPEEGIPHIENAIRLSPHDPNIGVPYWNLAHCYLLLGHVDQAIDLYRKADAANPQLWFIHLHLAAALGLRGDLDQARAELAESLRLKPDINSSAAARAVFPFVTNPDYLALAEKTINLGLRRAGFPDE
jgi:TolB-like protein/class 3 adenylate cyclase/cytochrome c-type biogenesis protein CcmH/NrfG